MFRSGVAILWWEDAVLLLFERSGLFFESLLVALILLVLRNYIACC
jgi:hypothetical protein